MLQFTVRLHVHVPQVLEMCPESHSKSEVWQTLPPESPALTPALTLTLGGAWKPDVTVLMSECIDRSMV